MFRLLVITDEEACRAQTRGVVETVARALLPEVPPGIAVLVRAKSRPLDHVRDLCAALRPVTRRARAQLLVHTHASLVAELGLDGAHLDSQANVAKARAGLPQGALLGASRHDGDPLDDAALDYVTLSPIFQTDERPGLGVNVLSGKSATSATPIVALGGIDETRAASCIRAGAAAVAVMGAVMGAHDPRRALNRIVAAT